MCKTPRSARKVGTAARRSGFTKSTTLSESVTPQTLQANGAHVLSPTKVCCSGITLDWPGTATGVMFPLTNSTNGDGVRFVEAVARGLTEAEALNVFPGVRRNEGGTNNVGWRPQGDTGANFTPVAGGEDGSATEGGVTPAQVSEGEIESFATCPPLLYQPRRRLGDKRVVCC